MKKNNLSRVIVSIILGIMTILLLTLNLWDKQWYVLIVYLLTGIITGVTFYDYHLILNAARTARIIIGEKIKALKMLKRKKVNFPKTSFKQVGSTVLKLLIIVINYGSYIYLVYQIFLPFLFKLTNDSDSPLARVLGTIALLMLLLTIEYLSIALCKKVKAIYLKLGFAKETDNEGMIAVLTPRFLIWGGGWYLGLLWLPLLAYRFALLIILATLALIQLAASTILAIGLIFKAIGQNGKALLISISIATGGLAGTFTSSYLIGLVAGLAIVFLAMVFKKLSTNLSYFFKDRANLAQRFWKFAFE